jgi:hypothetical protein
MRGVELSYHGDACTLETMLDRCGRDDPVLAAIARIVRQPDLDDERFDSPDARGLDVILRALSMVTDSDEQMLELTGPIYDGLSSTGAGRRCSADPRDD